MASRAYSLPNLLTYARIVCVPLVVLCFFLEGTLRSPDYARWSALFIFLAASVTDFLDGYLARAWQQTSTIGRMLDPIADDSDTAGPMFYRDAQGVWNSIQNSVASGSNRNRLDAFVCWPAGSPRPCTGG